MSTLTYSIKSCIACNLFSLVTSEKGREIKPFISTFHESINCSIYSPKYKFASYLPKGQFKAFYKELKEDSCCFKCLLPTVICHSIREDSSKCLRLEINFIFIALLYSYPLALDTCTKLSIRGPKPSLESVIKAYIKKVYIDLIATEGLLGFKALVIDN